MTAIVLNTRYDYQKRYRGASGNSYSPGILIKSPNNDTVYVLNYKLEKQWINYAGFMKYYGDWSKIVTLSDAEINSFPNGSGITDTTGPAILVAPAQPAGLSANSKSFLSKYGIWLGLGVIIIAGIVIWKKKHKK
jgi:hypothetical protein